MRFLITWTIRSGAPCPHLPDAALPPAAAHSYSHPALRAHHEAEVQDADFAVRRPQQVARMGIRVQQPCLQQLRIKKSKGVQKRS